MAIQKQRSYRVTVLDEKGGKRVGGFDVSASTLVEARAAALSHAQVEFGEAVAVDVREKRARRGTGSGSLFKRSAGGAWIASWFDYTGKRKERSTRTTDRAAAERILQKYIADVRLRVEGVIDIRQDRFAAAGRVDLTDHIEEYAAHCRRTGQDESHLAQKERHLKRLQEAVGATRLTDLTADGLERHMRALIDAGLSARTANFARQIAVAFASWCAKSGRLESNPLKVVPRLDERNDRRRVRRPLTDDELTRLLCVARKHGRQAWYLAAVLAGLRKGDLKQLRWCDVNFTDNTITLRGKSKRVDTIPMHPQLAEELIGRRDALMTSPSTKVFPTTVTDVTRLKDFLRAGIVREEAVTDEKGDVVMIGKGRRRRPKMRIIVEDEEGRVIDLHAMRTTLGTNLARAGVAPQIAQRVMRHADYRTTLKHYTVLSLTDTSAAIDRLASIANRVDQGLQATGTAGAMAGLKGSSIPTLQPTQQPRQLGCDEVPDVANTCEERDDRMTSSDDDKSRRSMGFCDKVRSDATIREHSRGCNSVVECQLPKLRSRNVSDCVSTSSDCRASDLRNNPRNRVDEALGDADLVELTGAWSQLPEAIRAGILAMIRAVG
jgi:integrase